MDSIPEKVVKKKFLLANILKVISVVALLNAVGSVTYYKFIWKPSIPSEARNAGELWSFLSSAPEESPKMWYEILETIVKDEKFFDQFSSVEKQFDQAFLRIRKTTQEDQ